MLKEDVLNVRLTPLYLEIEMLYNMIRKKNIQYNATDTIYNKYNFSREYKRQHNKKGKMNDKYMEKIENDLKILEKFLFLDKKIGKKTKFKRKAFESEEELAIFIYILCIIYKTVCNDKRKEHVLSSALRIEKNVKGVFDNFFKHYISNTKKTSFNCNFLELFDNNGNIISGNAQKLKAEASILYEKYKNSTQLSEDIKEHDYICISVDQEALMEEYDEQHKLNAKENQQKKIELKQQKEMEKQEREKRQKEFEEYQKNKPKVKRNLSKFEKRLSKYIDISTLELKKNVVNYASLEEIIENIKLIPGITKNEISNYINEYNNMLFNKRFPSLISLLSKDDLNLLKDLISSLDSEISELKEEVEEFITNDDYEKYKKDEIKKYIVSVIEKYKNMNISEQKQSNILIFPYEGFLNDELSLIVDGNSNDTTDTIIKSIVHHLKKLENHSINEILYNSQNAFHEIKSNGKPYRIGDSVVYRFGAKKSKICLIRPSVCKENFNTLKELYNLEDLSYLMIAFSVGSVVSENEQDYYDRSRRQGKQLENRIVEICNIFKTPFTPESLLLAKELIDNSKNQIQELEKKQAKEKEKIVNE